MRLGKMPVVEAHGNVATPEQSDFVFVYKLSTDSSFYQKMSDGTTAPIVGGSGIFATRDETAGFGDTIPENKVVSPDTLLNAFLRTTANLVVEDVGEGDRNDMVGVSAIDWNDTPVPTSGTIIKFVKTSLVNTGAASLNIEYNGTYSGGEDIVKLSFTGTQVALAAGDMPPGDYLLTYDDNNEVWVLLNPFMGELTVVSLGASSKKQRLMIFSDNATVAGGVGGFSFNLPNPDPLFSQILMVYAVCDSSGDAANPYVVSKTIITGKTVTGFVTAFTGAGGLPQAAGNGTTVKVTVIGIPA